MTSPFDPKYKAIVSTIKKYAQSYTIPYELGIWQLWQESRFKADAVSHVGAKGIAQFMPATALRFNVDPLNIESSIQGWAKYMRTLHDEFGSWDLALAGYNAGEGNVRKYNGIPPFKETQHYVKKIISDANLKKSGSVLGLILGFAAATLLIVKLSKS